MTFYRVPATGAVLALLFAACSSSDRQVVVGNAGASGAGMGGAGAVGGAPTGGAGGNDASAGSGGTPSGGSGGTPSGGSGGTADAGDGAAGDGAADAAVKCKGLTCATYKLGGVIDVPACCSADGACGIVVDATVGGLIGDAPTGCYQSEQSGNPDCTCPPLVFPSPLAPSTNVTFPGCCTPNGDCGYAIDLVSSSGPQLGCQKASWGADAGKACTSGTGSACDGG